MQEREFTHDKKKPETFDFRRMANILWRIKYWLALSVALCLAAAWLHVRYSTPRYRKTISVVINGRPNEYSDNHQLVSNALGTAANMQVNNRMFLLKSKRLMSDVVGKLGLNVRYFGVGRFVDAELYGDTPVTLDFVPAEGFERCYLDMTVSFAGGKIAIESLLINGLPSPTLPERVAEGQAVETSAGTLSFASPPHVDTERLSGRIRITRSGVERTAAVIASRLNVTTNTRYPDMLSISVTDRHPRRAEDILNTLMEEFNAMSRFYDSQGIRNTIAFLDERIAILESELEHVEGNFASYRSSHELVDINSQSQMTMSTEKAYRDRLTDVALQIRLLDIVKEAVRGDDIGGLIPANIGIDDGPLNSSIEQYNRQVIERNRMLAGSSANNPMVQGAAAVLVTLKENMRQSVRNLEAAFNLQRQSLTAQLGSSHRQLAAMPSRQLAQTRVARLQQVKEPLYILLQQKREEAMLTLSSLSDHACVVDPASGSNAPVYPDGKQTYMLALFLSLGVPAAFVVLVNLLRTRILFEKDIIDRTDIPVLGIVPRGKKDKGLPMGAGTVTGTGRDPLTESFRMLRSKFQYLGIDKKKNGAFVLQITSSGPQEGKSFISVNMAISLSYLDKRVLLIGADLRKPAIAKYLGIDRHKPGLSDYLAGKKNATGDVIFPYGESGCMDVMPAGPVPFNPSELLSSASFGEMIDSLRPSYDYIIIDSAPFLMVADSFMISRCADSVLYVVRSGFTKLTLLDTLQNMYREGNFKSVMVVLNSVDFRRNAFYGDNKPSYSYAYGYGYGTGYGDENHAENKKKKIEKEKICAETAL